MPRILCVAGALLFIALSGPTPGAEPKRSFITGVNYPWIAYGHDFGKNEWGHDGLSTGGWTYQTYTDSQGFTDARYTKSRARSGTGSLRISADLIGQDPNRSKGEVYIDLANHTPPGISAPVDLTSATVSCWLFLPRGAAGDPTKANGVQFFFKSAGESFPSLYTPYQNIRSDQEERWVRFTADLTSPDYIDPLFDRSKVLIAGLKIGINSVSDTTLAGQIFVDDYALSANPPIAFDFEKLEVEHDFGVLQQTLEKCSVPAVRVFVFADGRASPEFGAGDYVTGLDEYFFEDFDVLLDAAERHGLKVIPVLLDFSWFNQAGPLVGGVQLGGRSRVIRDPHRRQAFLEKALVPLVGRYCDDTRILAWDVINEPEWATKELPTGFQTTDPVELAQMQEFVRLSAETIHSCATQKVTVGSARRMWMRHWRGLGLDLYQFHWYDHFAADEPFPWEPYSELELDKPAMAGEVPTDDTRNSTRDYLLGTAGGGYEGLLVWSYRAGDKVSSYANARTMLESWCGTTRRRTVRR